MGEPRDFQRQRIYDAERYAFGDRFAAFDTVSVRRLCGIGANETDTSVLPCRFTHGHAGTRQADGTVIWEQVIHRKHWHPWALRTVAECQSYIDDICEQEGLPYVRAGTGRRSRRAHIGREGLGFRVALPLWARVPLVIIHELAHAKAWDGADSGGHRERFAAEYLRMVEYHSGREDASRLRASFESHGVHYRIGSHAGAI